MHVKQHGTDERSVLFKKILRKINKEKRNPSESCLGNPGFTTLLCKSILISLIIPYFEDGTTRFNNISNKRNIFFFSARTATTTKKSMSLIAIADAF